MTAQRPWTPDMLADRWGCSGETVRKLCATGRLPAFRVGVQWRIRPEVVEEYEQCGTIASDASEGASSSHGPEKVESATVTDFPRPRSRVQRRKAETFFEGKPPGPLGIW